jgi:hypothetical protein
MNHEQIDQFDLIDRYLMGKLPAEESVGFEEHFVDCQQCLARLQTTKCFLQDLRLVAAEQASQIDHLHPRSAFWHFPQTLLRKPLAWVAACLLIAAVATGFVVNYTQHLRTSRDQAENRSEQWQRRYEDERQAVLSIEKQHQETELQWDKNRRDLETKLQDEEAKQAKRTADFSQQMILAGNLTVLPLISVRGSAANAPEITLHHSSSFFLVSISLEGEKRFETYRIKIFDDHSLPVGKSRLLMPGQEDFLLLSLPAGIFRPGQFSLVLEGVNKSGGAEDLGNYPFKITKTR